MGRWFTSNVVLLTDPQKTFISTTDSQESLLWFPIHNPPALGITTASNSVAKDSVRLTSSQHLHLDTYTTVYLYRNSVFRPMFFTELSILETYKFLIGKHTSFFDLSTFSSAAESVYNMWSVISLNYVSFVQGSEAMNHTVKSMCFLRERSFERYTVNKAISPAPSQRSERYFLGA